MKRATIATCVLCAFLAATAEATTLVGCDNNGQGLRLSRPALCNFSVSPPPRGAVVSDAGHIYVERMRKWANWGARSTKARGTFVGNMDSRKRITVRLFGRTRCVAGSNASFYVYTLARFKGLSERTSYLGSC